RGGTGAIEAPLAPPFGWPQGRLNRQALSPPTCTPAARRGGTLPAGQTHRSPLGSRRDVRRRGRRSSQRSGGDHMRRIVLVLALITGIVIGFGVPVSGLGLISVTLTCSDGTRVTMHVDTDTLNRLTDSVDAMTLHPAAL